MLIYDIVLNPALNNIMSMVGLFLLVAAVLRVKAGGTAWWGIPCSPWVWISRGSTGRSLFNVGGNGSKYVRMHNELADRCAALIELCLERSVDVIVDQPLSSILFKWPSISKALRGLPEHVVWMRDFCGESPKPFRLRGPAWLQHMKKFSKRPAGWKRTATLVNVTHVGGKNQSAGRKGT